LVDPHPYFHRGKPLLSLGQAFVGVTPAPCVRKGSSSLLRGQAFAEVGSMVGGPYFRGSDEEGDEVMWKRWECRWVSGSVLLQVGFLAKVGAGTNFSRVKFLQK